MPPPAVGGRWHRSHGARGNGARTWHLGLSRTVADRRRERLVSMHSPRQARPIGALRQPRPRLDRRGRPAHGVRPAARVRARRSRRAGGAVLPTPAAAGPTRPPTRSQAAAVQRYRGADAAPPAPRRCRHGTLPHRRAPGLMVLCGGARGGRRRLRGRWHAAQLRAQLGTPRPTSSCDIKQEAAEKRLEDDAQETGGTRSNGRLAAGRPTTRAARRPKNKPRAPQRRARRTCTPAPPTPSMPSTWASWSPRANKKMRARCATAP